jgi:hypothetical protein
MTIDEFVSRIFLSRNAAHLAHWRTKSYAQHVALGSFYDDIIDAVDKFVEAYMGATGKVIGDVEIPAVKPPKDILKHLTEEVSWIDENRSEIANGITALENIVDEITGIYLSTIYKLKQLS